MCIIETLAPPSVPYRISYQPLPHTGKAIKPVLVRDSKLFLPDYRFFEHHTSSQFEVKEIAPVMYEREIFSRADTRHMLKQRSCGKVVSINVWEIEIFPPCRFLKDTGKKR
jgi:hypothetical protein